MNKYLTILHLTRATIPFLLMLSLLLPTPSQALSSVTAKWLTFDSNGEVTLGTAKSWQRDWTHTAVLRHNLLLVYDRNSGNAKTAVIAHDGNLLQPKTYKWTKSWSDVVAANFLDATDANLILYSRDSGQLKAFNLATNKSTLRFAQNIPVLITNTDKAKGWDIVVPFTYAGMGRVLFYQRSTGTVHIYKYSSSDKQLVFDSEKSVRNYWDQIAAGNFDNDNDEELVFHNQDSGQLRVWDPYTGNVKDLPNAGISHTALLGVGTHYGGGPKSDILLYQAHYRFTETCGKPRIVLNPKPGRHTASDPNCHGGGRATLYVDKADQYIVDRVYKGWRSDWTHLIANNYSFGLYSNAREVKLRFVIAGLSDASAAIELADTGIKRWIDGANRTFAAAGLNFQNSGSTVTQEPVLAAYVCGGDRQPLSDWATNNVATDEIAVIITPSNTQGCSSGGANFIAMTRPTGKRRDAEDDDSTYTEYYRGGVSYVHDSPSTRGLAHELGHFFQLSHSLRTKLVNVAEVETFLKKLETSTNQASLHQLDGDRFAKTNCGVGGGCYLRTNDTIGELDDKFWDNEDKDRCDDGPVYTFTSNFSTVRYSAPPHDVMSYIRCDRTDVLSKDQIRAVRQSLYNLRKRLIQ